MVAGVMSLRPEMHVAEKIAWILILVSFTYLEVRAIGISDQKNETARAVQNAEFSAIVDKLKESDRSNSTHFDETMKGVGLVFDKTKLTADTATKAVNTMTGGDSRPYLDPTEPIMQPDGTVLFNLVPRIKGKYPLRDVNYYVYSAQRGGTFINEHLDTLYPGASYRALKVARIPLTDQSNNELFQIMINASNGPYDEEVRFRKINGRWVHALQLKSFMPSRKPVYFQEVPSDFGDADWDKP